jgi:hypothetical protein
VLVSSPERLPKGNSDNGGDIRAVSLDTFASEWSTQLHALASNLQNMSKRCVLLFGNTIY